MKLSNRMFSLIFIKILLINGSLECGLFLNFKNALLGNYQEDIKPSSSNSPTSSISIIESKNNKVDENSKKNLNGQADSNRQFSQIKVFTVDPESISKDGLFIPVNKECPSLVVVKNSSNIPANITNLSINNTNEQQAKQNSMQEQNNNQDQVMKNLLALDLLFATSQISKNIQKFFKDHKRGLLSFYRSNKKTIIGGGIGVLYFIILYKMKSLESELSEKKCWSRWRESSVPFRSLVGDADLLIVKELCRDIYARYPQNEDKKVFLSLMAFLNDTEKEIKLLEKYIKYYSLLKKLKLKSLFFIKDEFADSLNERLCRIEFLRGRLINWAQNDIRFN